MVCPLGKDWLCRIKFVNPIKGLLFGWMLAPFRSDGLSTPWVMGQIGLAVVLSLPTFCRFQSNIYAAWSLLFEKLLSLLFKVSSFCLPLSPFHSIISVGLHCVLWGVMEFSCFYSLKIMSEQLGGLTDWSSCNGITCCVVWSMIGWELVGGIGLFIDQWPVYKFIQHCNPDLLIFWVITVNYYTLFL